MSGSLRWGLAMAVAAAVFITASHALKSLPRQSVRSEMQIALPLFVQVFASMGDRYLAANLAAIRALVADTFKMRADEFSVLAKVQEDVSWLNPGHEDNYYIAAAILPWAGRVDPAQRILERATFARRYDYQPAFLYGFNQLHFRGDPASASAWLREAALHLPEGNNRLQMENLAATWMDKVDDVDLAIRVVEALAGQAKRRDFKHYLELRVERLKMLKMLRTAVGEYVQRKQRFPHDLNELITAGLIERVPDDPFGLGFDIDSTGLVKLRTTPR